MQVHKSDTTQNSKTIGSARTQLNIYNVATRMEKFTENFTYIMNKKTYLNRIYNTKKTRKWIFELSEKSSSAGPQSEEYWLHIKNGLGLYILIQILPVHTT